MAPLFTPERHAFREAVAAIAEKARATLPECNGRVEKAVGLVLHGDVALLPDGTAQVYSQSNGITSYAVVHGHCDCSDSPRAPHGFCKHRLAAAIAKRVTQVLATPPVPVVPEDLPEPWPDNDPEEPLPAPPEPPPLPEAPASVNCHLTLAGRQVQLTLRDTDEGRLLQRLQAVLAQYPVPAPTAQPEGWCGLHQVEMRLNRGKDGKSDWYSHRTRELQWCKGK